MASFPFSAIVGSDDLALALTLTTIDPAVGGVLVRGEKGTAKTTMVRALAEVLPPISVIDGCRFSCDPEHPDPGCPDGPHGDQPSSVRSARLVELPVGASEDRVIGSLDLQRALGAGQVYYEPGLLAAAHRGILYVDEVNLLHDHLVDLLLDAAAVGRSTVEREGASIAHASQLVLIGTMNPEEGELRPQLLDRFGLTVEIAAPREPQLRAEVVRRRMAFDRDPDTFVAAYAEAETALRSRIDDARGRLNEVRLDDRRLLKIAEICAAFEVDGMRADLVIARAAVAHAAWHGRGGVNRSDLRAAARLALPHRRRRNPFDAPGLDEDLLDRLLGDEDEPEPEPDEDSVDSRDDDSDPDPSGSSDVDDTDSTDDDGQPAKSDPSAVSADPPSSTSDTESSTADPAEGPESDPSTSAEGNHPDSQAGGSRGSANGQVAKATEAYRTRLFTAAGVGQGEAGRRSRAITSTGRVVGALPARGERGQLHLTATLRAAAPQQGSRGRASATPVRFAPDDLRLAVTEGRESNLVLLVVDASGSMAARRRMAAVKTAALSLLLDAYQRRDKVGLITFRGGDATLALPPTSSIDVAARRLAELPSGGRTPLAEGLLCAAETLRLEKIRDPRRRPLLVLVTDGRATFGPDAVRRSRTAADHVRRTGVSSLIIDCETGRFSLGLAAELSLHLGAEHTGVGEVAADQLVSAVRSQTVPRTTRSSKDAA